ncbi:hypothetical protein A3Q56_08658 [Intoshia linei]|uniref:PLAT domain-containing protein n=1 Tax=Intoshia linei TaxID=1819745 RepID=A0A177ANK5_9BILA|nr:hypothetical protein A3Q56_08658 [Intoshia linei]
MSSVKYFILLAVLTLSVIFPCHRWISNKIGYKQICIELIPTDEKAAKRKDSLTFERKNILTTYLIKVATGNVWGAGTDANIHIVLYGTKDDSGIINLKNSETHKNKFERGTIDKFSVELYEIGSIEKIL